MSDPTTPTGKRLFEEWAEVDATQWRADIIAIEQETAAAAQADADRLAEALRQVQQCLVTLDSESLSMLGRDALEAAKTWPDEALRLHDKAAKVVA